MLVKTIREVQKNHLVRIILRTGQPGQAPERQIIVAYDINDYKEKTELTSQKLFSLMYTSLRGYSNIIAIERHKSGLKKIIDSTAEIFSRQPLEHFFNSTLEQLTSIFCCDKHDLMQQLSKILIKKHNNDIKIVSATGEYSAYTNNNPLEVLSIDVVNLLKQSLIAKKNVYQSGFYVAYFSSCNGEERLLFFKLNFNLTEIDQHLIAMYIKHASISFDNLTLYQKVEKGQQEIVNILATSIETRSKETGNHVNRVAEFAAILGKIIGLSPEEVEVLKFASTLHDFGKIAIPDIILNKPEKLNDSEWNIMQTHAAIGYDLLIKSRDEFLKIGAIISNEHHEKWDGSGYPLGKKGEEIHVFGRITAIADVFDALANKRCYKEAWPIEDIFLYFQKQRGKQFAPNLVDALLENANQFTEILEQYQD